MKNKNKLWGNGIGLSPELWFKKPKEFVFNKKDGSYRPKGDRKSTVMGGGYWIEEMGLARSADCITILSHNYDDVRKFIKETKNILEYPSFWQKGYIEKLKTRIKYKKIKINMDKLK